jgi:hypothetical protein
MRSDPRLVIAAVAAVAVCAVFACSFAIGRATESGHATLAEGPSALALASGGPAIPVGLSSAPPLDAGTVARPAPAPNRRSAARAHAAQPLSSHVFPMPVQISKPAPALAVEPPASSAPNPVPSPAPAPTPSLPPTGSSGSGGGSSGGGAGGGGASFDSSG